MTPTTVRYVRTTARRAITYGTESWRLNWINNSGGLMELCLYNAAMRTVMLEYPDTTRACLYAIMYKHNRQADKWRVCRSVQ